MGQHSRKPSPQTRKLSPSQRRWAAITAGVAIAAAASTTAWAMIGNDDSPKPAAALTPPSPTTKASPSPAPTQDLARATQPDPTTSPDHQNSATLPKAAVPSPSAPTSTERPSSTHRRSAADQRTSSGTRTTSTEQSTANRPAASKPKKPKLRVISSGTCGASYYGEPQMTASGERFNPNAMTAAHKTLPLGSKVRVTNPRTGESVTVRINDRGPYVGGRCLDLSTAAFAAIGNTSAGVMQVKYEVLAR